MTTTDPAAAPATCPVKNFDYRVLGPVMSHFETYDELREEQPWYRNEMAPGFWTMVNHEGILEVMQNTDVFSTQSVTVFDPNPAYKWVPMLLDGDEHLAWRRLLGPIFSPKQIEKLDDHVRSRAVELIEEIAPRGECDFMADFAHKFPTSIFLELMGLPVEELPQFMEWESALLHASLGTEEEVQARLDAMTQIQERFKGLIAERRQNPADDIVSRVMEFEIEGEPVPDSDLLSLCLFLFMAGLDTVSVSLGWSFWHMATHEADRKRVAEDPSVTPHAVEEFIRVYASIISARKATEDTAVQGCPIKKGEMVNIPLNASTRDESAFDRAKEVVIDRFPNNHIAFGAGPHRCLGSHLARRELRIAIDEWHKRIPDYRLVDGVVPQETGRLVGLTTLPLVWDV